MMLAGPLIVGLGNVLSATAESIEILLAWRFVAGAGSAIYMIAAATVISDIADDSNRGTMGAAPQTYAAGIVPEGNRGLAMGIYRSGGSSSPRSPWG